MNSGCTDTDNNNSDFAVTSPSAPRNSSTAVFSCAADIPPTVTTTVPDTDATGVALDASITVTFSEAVTLATGWYAINCATSGAHTAGVDETADPVIVLNPVDDFAYSETCTVSLEADFIMDEDGTVDHMAADYAWSFTTTGSDADPSVTNTTPGTGATGIAANTDITIEFSEPVTIAPDSFFDVFCSISGDHSGATTGGPTTYTFNPTADFLPGETCTATVQNDQVLDQDPPAQPMAVDHVWTFTITAATNTCGDPYIPIHNIQGSDLVSPIDGQTVITEGIVTANFQTLPTDLNGFFIQAIPGTEDADALTSEGVFVYNTSLSSLVGNIVRVRGTVGAYQNQTQLTSPTILSTCSTGNALPAAIALDLPDVADAAFSLEPYEGMLVTLSEPLTVQQNYYQGRFGQVTLGAGGRIPQIHNVTKYTGTDPYYQFTRMIVLDDASSAQNPDPIPYYANDNYMRAGDTITGLTGVLDQGPVNSYVNPALPYNWYRVHPTVAVTAANITHTNPRPATPPAVGGRIVVASANVLNYFPTLDQTPYPAGSPYETGNTPRGADNATEFARQEPKIVEELATLNADVIGLMEIESWDGAAGGIGAPQALCNALNAYIGTTGLYAPVADPTTGSFDPSTDGDTIQVALIYKTTTVVPVGNALSSNDLIFDRSPFAAEFEELATGDQFIVVVNHFKSKGSCPAVGDPNADQGDGQGCWNLKRRQQAAALLSFINADLVTLDPDVLVIGDLNSYGAEDPTNDLIAGGLVNQVAGFVPEADRYSYVFDGTAGYLDHALGTPSTTAQITDVSYWHINADEPIVIDYNLEFKGAGLSPDLYEAHQYRAADHDPVLIGLNLIPAPITWADDAWIGLPDGTEVTPAFPVGSGTHTIGYDAFDTIQEAITAVAAGGTTYVAAGLYDERINITKKLTLLGATAGESKKDYVPPAGYAYDPAVETIIQPTADLDVSVVRIGADEVVVDGIVVANTGILTAGNMKNLVEFTHTVAFPVGSQLINSVIGPLTGPTQDGTLGRFGVVAPGPSTTSGSKTRILTISDNYIYNCLGNGGGLAIIGAMDTGDELNAGSQIVNNTITGNHRSGIEIAGEISGTADTPVLIANNTITDNGATNAGDDPANLKFGNGIAFIRIGSDRTNGEPYGLPSHVLLLNNLIAGNEKNGIYMGPQAENITIAGNTIQNNGALGAPYLAWDGIQIDLTELYYGANPAITSVLQNIVVTGNNILGNGGLGVNVIGGEPDNGPISAAQNWWGTATSAGVAAQVSAFVNYCPWLDALAPGGVAINPDGNIVTNVDTGELFCSIQAAIDDADTLDGHTISAPAGIYVENITVSKALTLEGPNAAVNPNTGTRGAEAVIVPTFTDTDPYSPTSSAVIYIEVDGVTLRGFTVDGDNPNLTSGVLVGTADVDAIEGIGGYEGVGQIVIENNVLQNFSYAGLDFSNDADTSATTDNHIRFNKIHNISSTIGFGIGVVVQKNFYADITDNVLTAVRVGVQTGNFYRANPGTTASISNNSIETSRRGIFHNLAYSDASPFTISGNTFTVLDAPTGTKWDAIMLSSLQGSVNATVTGNIITGTDVTQLTAGYQIWNTPTTALLTISGGSVSGTDYGVWVNNFDGYNSDADNTAIILSGVQISDTALAGVYILDNPSEVHGHTVKATLLDGVVINDCTTGIWVSGPQASVNSYGNLIQNNATGALFESDAAGTLANNSLTGNTTAITNTGATLVNASSNWFSTADATAVAGLISDVVDYTPWLNSGTDTGAAAGFQGDFTYLNVDDDSPQAGSVGRIQEGVNLATAGGTVYVWTGTYPEQVTITKDLALLGEDQATTIIQAFANMPVCFTTAAANRPIVCVMDAVATIDGFTIDGLGLGNSNNRFQGVALRNAGGTIQNNIIRDIRDNPFSGAQHGVAVYAYNTNGTHYTIHVLDNVITGFQKTAIALNTDTVTPETVDIQRNTITGAGATPVTAQNGIQVWSDLGDGLVADNTISGIAYDGLDWMATSILNYYADLDITGNTVTDAHLAIYNIDGSGLIADNDLTIIKTATYPYAYGIVATDPPQAIPSPFDPQARPDNQLTGNGTNALLGVEVANNVVTFNGTDKTGTTAIEADAAYGPNDLALNVHDNIVTGFDYGLVFYQCDPATSTTCDTGVFTAISANHNDLVGNAMGIYLGGPIPAAVVPTIHHNRIFGDGAVGLYNDLAVSVTAENNWWGCNEGPNDVAGDCDTITGTGVVDADPWLVLSAAADPTAVQPLGTSTIAADMIFNSDAADTSAAGYLPDGIPAAYTAPDGGTLSETAALTLNGTLLPTTTFTAPAADQAYQVCTAVDNELLCVDVTVQNVAPVAVDDTATTTEDTPVAILAVDLATNDTDANLDALTVTAVSNPTNGTVVLAAGTITFTPADDFNGTAGFDYTVSDGNLTDTGHVTVTVIAVNDAPVADDDTYTMAEDTVLDGTLTATDVDSTVLTFSGTGATAHGAVVINTDGTFTYTPAADYFGADSFVFTVSDGDLTDTGTITITITDVPDNAAPVAVDNAYEMDEDTILNIEAPGVLNNDTDADGDTLTAMLVVGPTNGTLVLNADGSFTYTPSPNFFGTDAFTYKASDGTSDSNVATVTITVVDMPEPKYIYLPVILK